MQTLIHNKTDIQALQGKFVICIEKDKPNKTLMDFNWEFAKEKRLKLVSLNGFVDLYGQRWDAKSEKSFINIFNNYLFDHMIEEGEVDGNRFHRLLTKKELGYLFNKLKEENY